MPSVCASVPVLMFARSAAAMSWPPIFIRGLIPLMSSITPTIMMINAPMMRLVYGEWRSDGA